MSTTARLVRTAGLAAATFVLATAVAQAKPYDFPTQPTQPTQNAATSVPAAGQTSRMSPDATAQWAPVRRYGTYMPAGGSSASTHATAPSAHATAPAPTTSSSGVDWTAVSLAVAIVAVLLALGVVAAGRSRLRHA